MTADATGRTIFGVGATLTLIEDEAGILVILGALGALEVILGTLGALTVTFVACVLVEPTFPDLLICPSVDSDTRPSLYN